MIRSGENARKAGNNRFFIACLHAPLPLVGRGEEWCNFDDWPTAGGDSAATTSSAVVVVVEEDDDASLLVWVSFTGNGDIGQLMILCLMSSLDPLPGYTAVLLLVPLSSSLSPSDIKWTLNNMSLSGEFNCFTISSVPSPWCTSRSMTQTRFIL